MNHTESQTNRMFIQDTAKQIFGMDAPLWISHGPDSEGDGWPHLGYHSDYSLSPDAEKWIILDLGSEKKFDQLLTIQVSVPKGASATVLIPEGFTRSAAPDGQKHAGEQEKVELAAGEHVVYAKKTHD